MQKSQIQPIIGNIEQNVRLIDLRLCNLPDEVIKRMTDVYELNKK